MVDMQTARNLELIHNRITNKPTGTLFGLANHCSTPMGERLLRMNIAQPMTDPILLQHRLDAIEELIESSDRFFALKQSLKASMKKRVDLDKLISQIMRPQQARQANDPKAIEACLSQLIQIRHVLAAMDGVCAALAGSKSLLLVKVQLLLQKKTVVAVVAAIDAIIHADLLHGTAKSKLTSRNARLYAVKAGQDSILDAARQTYQENTADALDRCKQYAEKYNLPFKINFSTLSSSGYSLELPLGEVTVHDLPKHFINVTTKRGGKSITMTTVELVSCIQGKLTPC